MTVLKKTDREQVVHRVLQAAFNPRFIELKKKLAADVAKNARTTSPAFFKLYDVPENRPHLRYQIGHAFKYCAEQITMACPIHYAKPVTKTTERDSSTGYDDNRSSLRDSDLIIPTIGSNLLLITDPVLIAEYDAIWADFTEAQPKMSGLLESYKNREKFEADFPDFAKHLPALPAKIQLPAVIVDNVLADLAKLGVPKAA